MSFPVNVGIAYVLAGLIVTQYYNENNQCFCKSCSCCCPYVLV